MSGPDGKFAQRPSPASEEDTEEEELEELEETEEKTQAPPTRQSTL